MAVVEALIVNTAERGPQQMLGLDGQGGGGPLVRRGGVSGIASMGASPGVIDALTGGEYSRMQAQLDRLETALQIAIVASCVAGVAGLVSLLWPRRARS